MKKQFLFIMVIVLFGLTGCSNEMEVIYAEEEVAEISPAVVGGPINRTKIVNYNEPNKEYLVTINTTGRWYAMKDVSWIDFTSYGNMGNGYILVRIPRALDGVLARNGKINFYDNPGGVTGLIGTVNVQQTSVRSTNIIYGNVSPDYVLVDRDRITFNITINTPAGNRWSIIPPPFVTVNRTSGTGPATIQATVLWSLETKPRQSEIRILMNEGAHQFNIGVDHKPIRLIPPNM